MTTTNKDMIIYNQLAQTAYLERIQDNLNVFNSGSSGSIIYRSEAIEGDLEQNTFYRIGGEIEHRDVNSTKGISVKKIAAGESVSVKVPYKYGPYASTEEAFKRRARNLEEFAYLVGQDMADALMVGRLKYGLSALNACISGNTDMIAAGNIATDGRKTLLKAMRKFGDQFNRLGLWVMDSATYFDFAENEAEKTYSVGDITIYTGSAVTNGKPVLVTDQAAANTVFGLQQGAIEVIESQAPGFRAYDINDQENLAIGIRAEGTFNLNVLGYSWKDKSSINPKLEDLAKSVNWVKHVLSNKSTAGVKLDLSEVTPPPAPETK